MINARRQINIGQFLSRVLLPHPEPTLNTYPHHASFTVNPPNTGTTGQSNSLIEQTLHKLNKINLIVSKAFKFMTSQKSTP